MFIRIKHVKQKPYGYVVENTWKNGQAQQRMKLYLGRVFTKDSIQIDEAVESLSQLVQLQAYLIGFRNSKLCVDGKTLIFQQHNVMCNDHNVVIKSNEGYFCGYTIQELLKLERASQDRAYIKALAQAVVNCGMQISQHAFIELFSNLSK